LGAGQPSVTVLEKMSFVEVGLLWGDSPVLQYIKIFFNICIDDPMDAKVSHQSEMQLM
jgi:hypothetical protein